MPNQAQENKVEPKPGRKIRRTVTILITLVALGTGIWAIVNNLLNAESKSSIPIRAGAEAPDFEAVNSRGSKFGCPITGAKL